MAEKLDPVLESLLAPTEPEPIDPVLQGLLSGGLAGAGTPDQPITGDPVASGDFSVTDLFTGESRTTPRTEAAPEIGEIDTGSFGNDFRLALGLLSTMDPQAQSNLIQDILPEATIDTDELGNTFVVLDGEEFILNKPGASFQDVVQGAAQVLAFVPAARLKGFVARFFAGAGTSAGLDIGAEALGAEGAAEPVAAGTRAAIAGGIEAIAPPVLRGIGAGARAIRGQRAAPVGTTRETAALTESALEAEAKTGVDLFPAQRTRIPRELDRQAVLAELPGSAQQAATALEKQNKQAFDAVIGFLDDIAPERAVETGQRRIRNAAQRSIENAKIIRSQKASPIFDAAFEDARVFGLKVDPVEISLEAFPKGGEIWRSLSRVQKLIKNANGDLERLHNVKTEIDQMINKTGEGGLGPTTKRQLVGVQDDLVRNLEKASPGYAEARTVFREVSPEVDDAINATRGIEKVKDANLKTISKKLLDPEDVNPQSVLNARKAIESVDPDAWREIVRVELERRLGSIKPTRTGAIENQPGQFVDAIFGNAKSRKVLLNALPEGQRSAALYLETVLRRAARGRPGGSQTASRQEFIRELKGPAGAVARFLSNIPESVGRAAGKAVTGLTEDEILRRNSAAMARLMFDPSFKADLKAIARMRNANEAGKRMTELLTAVAAVETNEALR